MAQVRLLRRIESALKGMSAGLVMVLGTTLAAFVAVIDNLTDTELAFSVFYLVPVALVAWASGVRWGFLMAVVSAAAGLASDLTADHELSHFLVPYWNFLVRTALYLSLVFLLSVLKEALATEQTLARTDPLTGVSNPRRFMEFAEMELTRARRYERPFTIVYLDIDDFKRINDDFGHRRGDDILCALANELERSTRESDLVARLGGDEFAVLLPETAAEGAAIFLDRLCDRLNKTSGERVTMSVGAVTFLEPPATTTEMTAAADALMYEVKRSGKNGCRHEVQETAQPATESSSASDFSMPSASTPRSGAAS